MASKPAKGKDGSGLAGSSVDLVVLALRDTVYFPGTLNTLHVAREASVRALRKAMESDSRLLLLSQRDMGIEEPGPDDLYAMGTVCEVLQALPLPDGSLRASLRGLSRGKVNKIATKASVLVASTELLDEPTSDLPVIDALRRECVSLFGTIVHLGKTIPPEAAQSIAHLAAPGALADGIAHHLTLSPPQKQAILETIDLQLRLEELLRLLKREEEVLRLGQAIQKRVEDELADSQREYYLREQLKAIQEELRLRENRVDEAEEFRSQMEEAGLSEEARSRAEAELKRLDRMPAASPEALVSRAYLDCLVSLPWNRSTEDRIDVKAAAELLEKAHFGLKPVKDRILEHLAVQQLTHSARGPVLCFVGPPGVGKTSIARSIAEAMGRKFVRIALGGVRDEAEIRGHRRTYVGSMPGRVVQGLISCGARNPVVLLDEIDKLGLDGRGDPASALLELLDPEQNSAFVDHYLDVPFDLSEVTFVTTANSLEMIPSPLRDRFEIVSFPAYTDREKIEISRRYLVPRAAAVHGLHSDQLDLSDEALHMVVQEYTREAGTRALGRHIDALARKRARQVAEGTTSLPPLDAEGIRGLLGPTRHARKLASEALAPGCAWGLVVSGAGGDVLPIEVSFTPSLGDRPEMTLTGSLGDVMKESAHAALTFVRSVSGDADLHRDLHLHVPEAAISKDGPSAGLVIAAAMASAMLGRPLPAGVAITGEITLLGQVIGVGGVRDKLLAATRAGIREVILPRDNEIDLSDLPEEDRAKLKIHLVEDAREAFQILGLSRR